MLFRSSSSFRTAGSRNLHRTWRRFRRRRPCRQEFVAEKWGAGGDSDWRRVSADYDLTHLLSYNEPDHGEQSNVTVERAVEEWPRHLATGLRLGSPATTDFAWLYRFMDECRSRNYRVDFVAIHAYWGGRGSSVQVSGVRDWYKKLKEEIGRAHV